MPELTDQEIQDAINAPSDAANRNQINDLIAIKEEEIEALKKLRDTEYAEYPHEDEVEVTEVPTATVEASVEVPFEPVVEVGPIGEAPTLAREDHTHNAVVEETPIAAVPEETVVEVKAPRKGKKTK